MPLGPLGNSFLSFSIQPDYIQVLPHLELPPQPSKEKYRPRSKDQVAGHHNKGNKQKE
jgi:hypothetical protein